MKKLYAVLLTPLMLLASCDSDVSSSNQMTSTNSTDTNYQYHLIAPKGAPGLSYYSFLEKENYTVEISSPSNVIAAFSSSDYDAIIFDLTKGANFIKQGKEYKLARLVTSSNAYLVSMGNKPADDEVSNEDKIVSFGTNSLFTGLLKKVHNLDEVIEVSDVATAYQVASSGLYEGEKVDYVVLSEPYVSQLIDNYPTSRYLKEDISQSYYEYSKQLGLNGGEGYKLFPQAGLFISENLENNQGAVTSFLQDFDKNLNDLANNDAKEAIACLERLTDYDIQANFNMRLELIKEVLNQETNPLNLANAMGFTSTSFDINGFIEEAGIEGITPIPSSAFSKYSNLK